MTTYFEILKEVEKMPITDQFQRLNTLKQSLEKYKELKKKLLLNQDSDNV